MSSVVIRLNGKDEEITEGISIRQLLEIKKINPNVVACEHNLKIIKRAHLGDLILKQGDSLEVIQMIGGG